MGCFTMMKKIRGQKAFCFVDKFLSPYNIERKKALLERQKSKRFVDPLVYFPFDSTAKSFALLPNERRWRTY
jgi:hypothetical protein